MSAVLESLQLLVKLGHEFGEGPRLRGLDCSTSFNKQFSTVSPHGTAIGGWEDIGTSSPCQVD